MESASPSSRRPPQPPRDKFHAWAARAETWLTAALARRVHVRISCRPLADEFLNDGERSRLGEFRRARRRQDWLSGRSALRMLLRDVEPMRDPSSIVFPNPQISLSHADGMAVAVSIPGAQGTGVDYEPRRRLSTEGLDLFMTPKEAADSTNDLLQRWTIKEALYKACPDNAGVMLADFEVLDAGPIGVGRCLTRPHLGFRYASMPLCHGVLSVALLASTG